MTEFILKWREDNPAYQAGVKAEHARIRERASELIDQYENDGEYRVPEIRAFVADLLDGDGDGQ